LHTGGVAAAAISIRSRPLLRAMASASLMGRIPICVPSESMSLTFAAVILWLIRMNGVVGGRGWK